jgi:hypothetical protein
MSFSFVVGVTAFANGERHLERESLHRILRACQLLYAAVITGRQSHTNRRDLYLAN